MLKWVVAFIGLLLLVPVAQAASFDCANAATSVERAVCADPGLSAQDEILAQAYATALGGLSAEAAAEVKKAQHAWLNYAARVCTKDAKPMEGDYDEDGVACLNAVYIARMRALEASRFEDGFRFYPIDRYLVEFDPEAEEYSPYQTVADKHFATLKIDRTDEVAVAFNAMIDDMRKGITDFFIKGGLDIAPGDTSTDYEITTSVAAIEPHRIGLRTTGSWYGHGAAHPNYWVSYAHFLIEEKRALVASDIFQGEGWQKTLGALVMSGLKTQLEDGLWDNLDNDVTQWSADPSRWDFGEDGVIVQFQPYEVTAYAAGAPQVLISWSDMGGILAEHAERYAYY